MTPEHQARQLARLMEWGTWLATGVITLGLLLALSGRETAGLRVILAGTALFVLLPVFRLLLLGAQFLRRHEPRWAAVAGVVLVIIAAGVIVNL